MAKKNILKKLIFVLFLCIGTLNFGRVFADDLNLDVNLKAPVSKELSSYALSKKIVSADGQDFVEITVVEKDNNGEPVSEVPPEIKISGSGGYFSQLLFENGEWKTKLYSNTAEQKQLTIVCSSVFLGEEDVLFFQPLILPRVVNINGKVLGDDKKLIGQIYPDERVEITGEGTPGSHIKVYINPLGVSYSLDVGMDGRWSIIVDQNLVLGDYQIEAEASNDYEISVPRALIASFVIAERKLEGSEVSTDIPSDNISTTPSDAVQKPTLQDVLKGKVPLFRYFTSSISAAIVCIILFVLFIILLIGIYLYLKKKRNFKIRNSKS